MPTDSKPVTKRLGRLPVRRDQRTFPLSHYLNHAALDPAPPSCAWDGHTPTWGMMLNDSLGDCTIAAAGHLIQTWTANNYGGTGYIVPDHQVVASYSAVSGYNPLTGAHDDGAAELDVLNYWRRVGIGGHKIVAFMSVEPSNHDHVKAATYIFGGLYIGVALPVTAQKAGDWDAPDGKLEGDDAPGSWGGHAVPVVRYDDDGLTVVTWGALQRMTWRFWDAYVEEAYAVLGGADWVSRTQHLAPNGLDLARLQNDLDALRG